MNKKHLISIILSLIILPLFLIPYLGNLIFAQTTTSQYKGKIGNYPITIEVYKEGKDKIKGRYMYDKVGKWLKLEGKILKNNRVIIYEYDENNKNTGRLIGKIEKGNVLKIEKHINNKTKKYLNVRLPKIVLKVKFKLLLPHDYITNMGFSYNTNINFWLVGAKKCSFSNSNNIDEYCKKYYVQINNKVYGPYDDVEPVIKGTKFYIFFNNTSTYGWKFRKDNQEYIQINDQTYGPYDKAFALDFSENGSRYGWVFLKNSRYYIQLNDKLFADYDYIRDLVISPDGSKTAWVYEYNKKYYVAIVGQTTRVYGPYDWVSKPVFAKNASKYGFVFQDYTKGDFVQINDETYGPYHYIPATPPDLSFSDDGSKYGWVFKSKGKWYIKINEKEYGPYNYIEKHTFKLSSDGSSFAFIFKYSEDFNYYYIQINDQSFGPYLVIDLCNDASKYGWWYMDSQGKEYIRIKDEIYGPYDGAICPTFSNDSSNLGFIFRKDDKNYIQINDKTYGPYDYATFTFTKDNKAYIAYISGNELVIEEVE